MAIIHCRQPGGYYNNATVGSPDGSAAAPYNYTWTQIRTALIAGDTVRLHPSYLFSVTTAIEMGTMICGGSGGVLERWDVPGFDWIMPSFSGLEFIPGGAWVDVGSGNWQVTFNGSLGVTSRPFTSCEIQGWGGVVNGKNDVRKPQLFTHTNRRLFSVGELSAVGEYACVDAGSNVMRMTVKTGGANPTALWGTYAVSANYGPGAQVLIWNEVQNLMFRKIAFWGGNAYFWPAGDRQNKNVVIEDPYNLLQVTSAWSGAAYPHGTAVGATTNAAGYAPGATVITLASAGTGAINGYLYYTDAISFAGDPNAYRIANGGGNANVSAGGTITLAAPGLLQAIPAANTAITVRQLARNVNIKWRRPTCSSGWPTVGRVVNNTLPQEAGGMCGFQFFHGFNDLEISDLRVFSYSHSAFEFIHQTARTEEGLNAARDVRILCKDWSDPGDGYGQYNTVDCGPADYMRAFILYCRNWYVGPIKIFNQSVQSQISGSGILAARFVPGRSRPYSEGTLASGNYNVSNGVCWLGGSILGSTLPQENIEVVGAALDAAGNVAAWWMVITPGSEAGSIKLRSTLVYDAGQTKYRPLTTPPNDTQVWANASLWAGELQTGDAFVAPLLHDMIFVKPTDDAVIGCHVAGQTPNQTGGGMVTYTVAQINSFDGVDNGGGVWRTKGNAKFASLAAAGFDDQARYTGRRYVGRQRGSSARGYR